MKHAYLLHTGYGKTKLCLDKIMKAPRKPRTLLISTKKIVEGSWEEEIDKWYPGQMTYGFITGDIKPKERLKRIETQYDMFGMNPSMLDWYIKNTCSVKSKRLLKDKTYKYTYNTDELLSKFDLIIFDEVTLFKNSQSDRFKLVKKWVHKAHNVIVLSATPTPKNIEDIWSIIYLLDGGLRLGKNITAFRSEFAIAIPMSNGRNRYQYAQPAIDEVLRRIQDITTSVPAPEKALFPEPVIKKLVIKPDPKTEELLKRFSQDFIVRLTNGSELKAFSKNQLIVKTNQIANGSVYNKDQTVFLNDLKVRALEHILKPVNTPVLLFYTYKFDKEHMLKLPGAKLISTPQDIKDWNANKIKIGVLSPFSAAHGLNLQYSDCENVIWFSPIWDTEKWIQANARVCRRGQKRKVTISVLLMKHSYDNYMFELCQEKFKTQYNILNQLKND